MGSTIKRCLSVFPIVLILSMVARAESTDPLGDTFGSGGFVPDITSYSAIFDANSGTTTFAIDFAGTIAAPSSFQGDALYGFIDLDTDRNAATGGQAAWGTSLQGGNSWINYYVEGGAVPGDPIGLGDEFFIDLGSEAFHAGLVDLFDAATNTVFQTVAIEYTGTGIRLTLPILGAGDGSLHFGVLVGSVNAVTDRASNQSRPDSSLNAVPEPSSLVLSVLGLLGLAAGSRRSRSARLARLLNPIRRRVREIG